MQNHRPPTEKRLLPLDLNYAFTSSSAKSFHTKTHRELFPATATTAAAATGAAATTAAAAA